MRLMKTRWILAAVFLAVAARLMMMGMKIAGFGAAGYIIMSMVALVSAVVLIAPETAFKIAEWCAKPLTDLFFPSEQYKKPPLSYLLARKYRDSLRLEDSLVEYKNIIHFYPDEIDAYRELLDVARRAGDQKTFSKYARLLKRRFGEAPPPPPAVPDESPLSVKM